MVIIKHSFAIMVAHTSMLLGNHRIKGTNHIFSIRFRHSPSADASFHTGLENYNIKYKRCRCR